MFTFAPSRTLLEELYRECEASPAKPSFQPAVDVVQVDDGFHLRAELPGVAKESLQVELKDQTLSIAGEKAAPQSSGDKGYRYSEIRYGKFLRKFQLAESIDRERLEAKFENGVLDIRLYHRPEHGPRQIQIA